MAGEKTEKATPKKRKEAREKGQVARSTDLQGAVVLMAGIIAIGSAGPGLVQRMGGVMRGAIEQIRDPSIVSKQGIGVLMMDAGKATLLAVAPIAAGLHARRRRRQRRHGRPAALRQGAQARLQAHQPAVGGQEPLRAQRAGRDGQVDRQGRRHRGHRGRRAAAQAARVRRHGRHLTHRLRLDPRHRHGLAGQARGLRLPVHRPRRLRLGEAPHREGHEDGQAGDPRRGQEREPAGRGARR